MLALNRKSETPTGFSPLEGIYEKTTCIFCLLQGQVSVKQDSARLGDSVSGRSSVLLLVFLYLWSPSPKVKPAGPWLQGGMGRIKRLTERIFMDGGRQKTKNVSLKHFETFLQLQNICGKRSVGIASDSQLNCSWEWELPSTFGPWSSQVWLSQKKKKKKQGLDPKLLIRS